MYKTGATPGSFGPPAAQPSAVATSLCQEQAVAHSASSTPHRLPERLMESQPSSGQSYCCASRKPGRLWQETPRGKSRGVGSAQGLLQTGPQARVPGSSAQWQAPGWVGPGQLHLMCRWGYEAHASPQVQIAPHIREFQQSLQPSPTSREPAASPQGPAVATPTSKDGKLQLPLLPPFMRFPKGENHK